MAVSALVGKMMLVGDLGVVDVLVVVMVVGSYGIKVDD